MRVREVLFIVIIILVGLSINNVLVIKETGIPAILKFRGQAYTFQEVKEIEVAPGVSLDIQNHHGLIELMPWDKDVLKVELEEVIYSNNEDRAEELSVNIHLTLEQQDEKILIYTNRNEISLRGYSVRTNMKIYAPAETSGSITLHHGDVNVSDMKGNFKIEAHHADVDIRNIIGNVFMHVERGDLLLESIEGSASVQLHHAEAALSVIHDNLTLGLEHSSVEITNILQSVTIASRHSEVEAEEIKGNLEADCSHTEFYASNIGGDAIIKNNHKDITLRKIIGELHIESEHCDIDVERVNSNVEIMTEYATVSLGVPSSMNFSVDLLARHGEIDSDFDFLSPVEEKRGTTLTGTVGEGGPLYKIETSYNDIYLVKLSREK